MLVAYITLFTILFGRGCACPNDSVHQKDEITENCETAVFIIHTDLAPRLSQRGKKVELRGFRNCFANATVDYPLHSVKVLP